MGKWTRERITVSGSYFQRTNDGEDNGIRFLSIDETNKNSSYHPDFWHGWHWSEPIVTPPIDMKAIEIEQKSW